MTIRGLGLSFLFAVTLLAALTIAGDLRANPTPFSIPPINLVYPFVEDHLLYEYDLPGSELKEKGRNIRGIYLPVHRMKSKKVRQLAQWAGERVGANAVILDIKDDRGRVTFTKEVKGATDSAHGALRHKIPKLISELKKRDIYIIGRLVCFKDNQYMREERDAMILDKRMDKIWRDHSKMAWIDPYSETAREYIASIAKAAQDLGIDEIQLDYVRFPVDPNSRNARFPNRKDQQKRYEAIAALLERVDREVSIPLSIDVFGLTAYTEGDPEGLGQSLEHLLPYIDAISPMLYLANWPKRAWENPKPSRTYALVHNAVKRLRSRLGEHIAVRPLLQAFEYRALNFGVKFIQNQINAAENGGSSGYLFWNQSGHYWEVSVVWRRKATPSLLSPKN